MLDIKLCVCYGAMALFSAILHNVFLLYHVEMFVSIYKIDKLSFWIGEAVFLCWNSFNDPLFGWMSDKKYLSQSGHGGDVVLRRIKALTWNGPLFGLSFLAFWVSWTWPWLQFIVCLCLYDGFLTMIDLHHSALLADLAVSADTRTRLNAYCSVFGVLGSISVFLSYLVWNHEDQSTFQMFCCGLAAISITGYLVCTRVLTTTYMRKHKAKLEDVQVDHIQSSSGGDTLEDEKAALKTFLRQLSGHRNFMWFAAMNLVQVFHCHFNSNFFPLFLESLLGDHIPQTVCSLLLGISFVAPHINNLYFLVLVRRHGVYAVIRGLFIVKLLLSLIMCVVGPGNITLLCFFIASNRVFTEGTCKLLTLVISDLVDEDFVLHERSQAVSALLFGTAAFVSKPGQTLAPLIGIWLLSVQTGHDVFESGNSMGSIKMDLGQLDSTSQAVYRQGVFSLLVYVPIVCALLQLVAWWRFSLHGSRLLKIKTIRAGAKYVSV